MQTIWISIYLMLYLKMVKCCDCNLEEMIKDTVVKSSSISIEKRQMHNDEDDTAEILVDSETTEGTTESTDETTTVKSLHFQSTETTEQYKHDKNYECVLYNDVAQFSFDRMVDVWRIAYYEASDKLPCFKIHIMRTTVENRKILHNTYGDFHGMIDWKNCQFELASSATKAENSDRRHFLQGSKENKGVFHNIILKRDVAGNMTLLEQSPDQWLVVNHLLLMRDCDNGDIVVFSRVPIEPSLRDIEDALTSFGADPRNGTLACETLRDPKYLTLS